MCNDCFPNIQQTAFSNYIDFQGPSPDEIALLRGCRDNFNFYLKGSNSKCNILFNDGTTNEIEKYFVFKFDSTRKMMSVIVKFEEKYFLMVKGADNTVAERSTNGTSD